MTSPAPLPIGINSLSAIREGNFTYVDKTAMAFDLAKRQGRYFLSRPRRFGKSLFVDTLKELFEGNEPLFRGLHVHDHWDWQAPYPVIKLDFADGIVQNRIELDRRILSLLKENAQRLGLQCEEFEDIPGCFAQLIRAARESLQRRVVILIDEYDKPILDNIEQPERAAEVREGLKNLYSVMKGQDAHIQFIFMTGVTKFSKVSLFSGLNQLQDITLDSRFATLCGYTQHDLETTFADHLAGVDWVQLKRWYNGYQFLGEAVYNPFDILLFISKGKSYRNYWFETGSPSFLIKLFQQQRYFLPDLAQIEASEEILDSFDIERISPLTLLFQTGYLTIDSVRTHLMRQVYRLRIPNLEVKLALYDSLINGYTAYDEARLGIQTTVYEAFSSGDMTRIIQSIKRLFAGIPWRNFTHNQLAEAEGYYASVLYAFFASLDANVIPEDLTNHGQVDMTVQLECFTYVIEIKLDRQTTTHPQGENPALKQLIERDYSRKYRHQPGKGLFEVGLIFGGQARNLIQADWRQID